MAILIILFMVLVIFGYCEGRNLMYYPKCASFDTLHNRYLVSCCYNGKIIEVDENGQQKVFKSGLGSIISNHIVGDLLYVTREKGVYGINIYTAATEKNISISEATFLTGLGSDTSGNLYVADNTMNGQIYKINLADDSYSLYCIGLSPNPQDIEFDAENNRLVVVGYWPTAVIQTISLPMGIVNNISTVWCGPYDGVAKDRDGNYYFSCYETGKIFRYDKNLANPVELMNDLPGLPSNIDINPKNNVMSIPYIESHFMGYVDLDVDFTADTIWAWDSLTVNFEGISYIGADNLRWEFGDGEEAAGSTVQHVFRESGAYDITLFGDKDDSTFHITKRSFISVLADSLEAGSNHAYLGKTIEVVVDAENNAPLERLVIPVDYSGATGFTLDSFSTAGCRTNYFDSCGRSYFDATNQLAEYNLAYSSNIAEQLAPGSGPVLKLYFTVPATASIGNYSISFGGFPDHAPIFVNSKFSYSSRNRDGNIDVIGKCGDANGDTKVNLLDVSFMINAQYRGGPKPDPIQLADVNGDGKMNLLDVSYIINFQYRHGPDLKCP
jgi:hypothetical protein